MDKERIVGEASVLSATEKDDHLNTQKDSCSFVKPGSELFWVIPSLKKPQSMALSQSFWLDDLTEGRDGR